MPRAGLVAPRRSHARADHGGARCSPRSCSASRRNSAPSGPGPNHAKQTNKKGDSPQPFVYSCRYRWAPTIPTRKQGPPAMISSPARTATESSSAPVQRHHNEGHGRRLTAAFEALEAFPALAESRNRLLRLVSADRVSPADIVATVESDIALVVAVLRMANQLDERRRGRIESVVQAVEVLSPESVQALASRARTFDFFDAPLSGTRPRARPPARRRHAARRRPPRQRGRLRAPRPPHGHGAAARHRQARAHARLPRLPRPGPRRRQDAGGARAPRAPRPRRRPRARRRRPRTPLGPAERGRLRDRAPSLRGCDRRSRVRAPRRHARPLRPGRPGLAELAAEGRAFDRARPDRAARRHVRPALPDLRPPRQIDPCPLSGREVEVLKRLAEGKVYKQIAAELPLSTSTVRTHLHNIYGKLGAVDRAQAVLIATERGRL